MQTEADVRDFWFGSDPTDAGVAKARAALWWEKNAEVDARMRERFQGLVEEVGAGAHPEWLETPHGILASIIVTDQFPRNIYRDTPKSFVFDNVALGLARSVVDAKADRMLRPIERVFCYLPFEHSESLVDQDRAVELFKALHASVPPADQKFFAGYLDFAERHRAVIERFGRFPHRNRILGRTSTKEETAFLATPGSSF